MNHSPKTQEDKDRMATMAQEYLASQFGFEPLLKSGDSVIITEREFAVGIETLWKDSFIFLLDEDGKLISDNHLLFYNSRLRVGERLEKYKNGDNNYHAISPDNAIIGPFENEGHGAYESFELRRSYVNLDKLDPNVARIVFCLSAYNKGDIDADEMIHARLFTETDWIWGQEKGKTIALAAFPELYVNNTDGHMAEEIISLDRTDSGWELKVLGIEHPSIESIIEKYMQS